MYGGFRELGLEGRYHCEVLILQGYMAAFLDFLPLFVVFQERCVVEDIEYWLLPIFVELQVIHQVRRPLDLHICNPLYVPQVEDLLKLHRVSEDELVFEVLLDCGFQSPFLPSNGGLSRHSTLNSPNMDHEPEPDGQVNCIIQQRFVIRLGGIYSQGDFCFDFFSSLAFFDLMHDITDVS